MPRPPPAVFESTMFAARLAGKARRKKAPKAQAAAAAPEPRLPIIPGTGDFPSYESADDDAEDPNARPLTAYDELTRVVMRVNRVFANYERPLDPDEARARGPALTEEEMEVLHMGIVDMLALQEKVALQRKVLLKDAIAMADADGERDAPRAPEELEGGGNGDLVAKAIAKKESQTARLAALHQSEMELLVHLQREVCCPPPAQPPPAQLPGRPPTAQNHLRRRVAARRADARVPVAPPMRGARCARRARCHDRATCAPSARVRRWASSPRGFLSRTWLLSG